jgi:hypothetical protein
MRFTLKRTLPIFAGVLMLSLMIVGSAWASGKPTAETKEAVKISETAATVRGVVNPNGLETKYYFQYGTSISYGKTTTEVSVGAGTSSLEESKALTGLAASTTYDFRVVATNSSGTTDGANEVFTTPASGSLIEFNPAPVKKKFTSTGGKMAFVVPGFEESVACSSSTAKGEIGARTLGKVVITFTGCEITARDGTCPVNSPEAKPGEIVTQPLKGELGTVATKEAPSGVGVSLEPVTGKIWFDVEETACKTSETSFQGTAAAEVSVVGKKQTTTKLVIGQESDGTVIKLVKLDSGKEFKPSLEEFGATAYVKGDIEPTFEEALEVT